MTLTLSSDQEVQQKTVADFLAAKELWLKLARVERPGRVLLVYKNRCSLKRVAVTQLVGLLREGDGTPQSIKPHVNARTQSVLMSTGVEELNN